MPRIFRRFDSYLEEAEYYSGPCQCILMDEKGKYYKCRKEGTWDFKKEEWICEECETMEKSQCESDGDVSFMREQL